MIKEISIAAYCLFHGACSIIWWSIRSDATWDLWLKSIPPIPASAALNAVILRRKTVKLRLNLSVRTAGFPATLTITQPEIFIREEFSRCRPDGSQLKRLFYRFAGNTGKVQKKFPQQETNLKPPPSGGGISLNLFPFYLCVIHAI